MRSMLVAMAIAGLPTALLAAPQDQRAPCRQLAEQVRQRARTLPNFLKLDADHLLAPTLTARPAVTSPPAAVRAAAERLLDIEPGGGVALSVLSPGVWRAERREGTANCTRDVFFRLERGRAVTLPAPPAFTDLCWTSSRSVGAMNHVPVLVQQDAIDGPLPGFDAEITPWRQGWRPACRLSVRYRDAFTVTEAFGADLTLRRGAAPLASQLASALARSRGVSEPSLASAAPIAVARRHPALMTAAKRLAERDMAGADSLPTFGQAAKTQFTDFSDTVTATVVSLDGEPMVARVGIGGVGWRPIGDYLVVLYRQGTSELTPVASFVVTQTLTGLLSATASAPKPWTDNR
ncbi:hypothetical protein [Caulobacter segnis]|nr:hypothetical protein [Caulobacter segnis]